MLAATDDWALDACPDKNPRPIPMLQKRSFLTDLPCPTAFQWVDWDKNP